MPLSIQAPAKRLKLFAKSALKESGSHHRSGLLARAANSKSLNNAERDLHKLFRENDMVMPVPVDDLEASTGLNVPCIPFAHWFPFLMERKPEYLLGGFPVGPTSELLLGAFWRQMRASMPDHEIFLMHSEATLARTVPWYLHMDEGVGQRRRAVLVVAGQAVFGRESAQRFAANRAQCDDATECMVRAQYPNHKGDTYKSRFLWSCLSKKMYSKKNEPVFWEMLEQIAEDCRSLALHGFWCNGQRFYAACLGLKGDAPALKKAGCLTRSFQNMGANRGCCHECLAGHDGLPYEDVGENAKWIGTICLERPWKRSKLSPLADVPTRCYRPELFYHRDPFHTFKQSLGGHFCANTVVMLSEWLYFTQPGQSTAVANVLEDAYKDFDHFVKCEWKGKGVANLKSFTKEVFHYPKIDTYPFCRPKGSDIMLMVRWFRHLILHGTVDADGLLRTGSLLKCPLSEDHLPFLADMLVACEGALDFFQIMYREGLWIEAAMAQRMADACDSFAEAYGSLALQSFEKKWTRFRMEPCLHAWRHFSEDIKESLQSGAQFVYNCAAHNCEADEDFVGKIARTSRHVHMSTMAGRTLDRYLIKLKFAWESD